MHGLHRALGAVLLAMVALNTEAQPPEFTWLNQFAGFPELAAQVVAPAPDGFVASTGNRGLPMAFRAPDGTLECHMLIRYENGQWSTTGNVGTLTGSDDICGFISGARPVKAVTPFGSSICIGGDFRDLTPDNLDHFACHTEDGNWLQINGPGNGPNGPVEVLAFDGSNVYLGGSFTEVDGAMGMPTSALRIVRTSGFSWEPLPSDDAGTSNGVNGTVSAILPANGIIYAGVGSGVRRWNPSVNNKWSDLGSSNTSNSVRDIEFNSTQIAAASALSTQWGGETAGAVSEYSSGDMSWSAVGSSSGINTRFGKLAVAGGFFHATGDFTSIDPEARGLARLNASLEWEAVPDSAALGDSPTFTDLFQMGGDLCGVSQGQGPGQLFFGRGVVCNDGQRWRGLSQGINGRVNDVISYNGAIVAGGQFSAAGDELTDFVAEYRGGSWQALSDGLAFTGATGSSPGNVQKMAVFRGDLYVTGLFNEADGQPAPGLARWNGQSWQSVGEGVNFPGSEMLVWNDQLIFTGTTPSGLGPILSWDGVSISEFADVNQVASTPSALAVYNGDLIASARPGSGAALFRFNGTAWDLFAGDEVFFSGAINTMVTRGNLLYVGGEFAANGNAITDRVAVWNGSSWSGLGGGLQGGFFGVQELALVDDALIAIGSFETSGAATLEKLAYFDGQQWYPLGPGLFNDATGSVGETVLVDGATVYVGGIFEQAGNEWAENIGALTLRLETLFASGFEPN